MDEYNYSSQELEDKKEIADLSKRVNGLAAEVIALEDFSAGLLVVREGVRSAISSDIRGGGRLINYLRDLVEQSDITQADRESTAPQERRDSTTLD